MFRRVYYCRVKNKLSGDQMTGLVSYRSLLPDCEHVYDSMLKECAEDFECSPDYLMVMQFNRV